MLILSRIKDSQKYLISKKELRAVVAQINEISLKCQNKAGK